MTETGNIILTVLLYITTAITFAYSLRFFTLIFMGKKSAHLEKLHLHEAPKIMLAPATILAVLCVAWGLIAPWLASFMHTEAEVSLLAAFLNIETPIFLAILVPTGLLIYMTYYKDSQIMAKIRSSANPLTTLLKHGYFFDDVYEGAVAKGTMSFSDGLRRFEDAVFARLPLMVAGFFISAAIAVRDHFDILADQLLNLVANKTLRSASKMKKVPSNSLQHYISAAVIGFILILILIIATMGIK